MPPSLPVKPHREKQITCTRCNQALPPSPRMIAAAQSEQLLQSTIALQIFIRGSMSVRQAVRINTGAFLSMRNSKVQIVTKSPFLLLLRARAWPGPRSCCSCQEPLINTAEQKAPSGLFARLKPSVLYSFLYISVFVIMAHRRPCRFSGARRRARSTSPATRPCAR